MCSIQPCPTLARSAYESASRMRVRVFDWLAALPDASAFGLRIGELAALPDASAFGLRTGELAAPPDASALGLRTGEPHA